jgi:hypothetical protein
LLLFAIGALLSISTVAGAQPGEGRGRGGPDGPGGPGRGFSRSGSGFGAASSVRLAAIPEVQKALKLSKDQKKKVREINDKFRDDFRSMLQQGGGPGGIEKLSKEASAQLAETLDDDQEKRLRGITIQILGASAVTVDAELAKELNVTEEQKAKLEKIQHSNMQAMADAFQSGDVSSGDRRKKFEEMRKAGQKKLLDVLTSEQQKKLDALKGEEVEIDMSKLRAGGSGNRSRGGERGRSDRDRDRDRNSSSENSASTN